MALQRLVLDFRNDEEIVVRCLYGSSLDAPNPGTVRRRRQVEDLVREGLGQALASLESDADTELVGCSGFVQREDVLLATASPSALETTERVETKAKTRQVKTKLKGA